MIAALLLTIAIDSTPPAEPSYERVMQWVDTTTYWYLEPSDEEIRGWREDEHRYDREKSGKLQVTPTYYPSPWYKRPEQA